MARETGPIGDPQLPQVDNPFGIDNPSQEVLRRVFEFPFPPHDMKVEFKKIEKGGLNLPFTIRLDSSTPSIGNYDSKDFLEEGHRISDGDYESRMKTLKQVLKSGYKSIAFLVGDVTSWNGDLSRDPKREFNTFNFILLPGLVTDGYEISSIDVDFDGGYTDSSWSEINPDGDLYSVNPHTLKYDGEKLSIYSDHQSTFYGRFAGEKPVTVAQHDEIKKYWDNIRNLTGVQEVKPTEEQFPVTPQA